MYSNSVFHIHLKSKGAYLVKINGQSYPVKKIYALNSFESDVVLNIEIFGVYSSLNKVLKTPIHRVETKVPFSQLNKSFEISSPISIMTYENVENLTLKVPSLNFRNKNIHLKRFYSKTNTNSTQVNINKDLYHELENSLKKENI